MQTKTHCTRTQMFLIPVYISESLTGYGTFGCPVTCPLFGLSSNHPKQGFSETKGRHVKESKSVQQGKIC